MYVCTTSTRTFLLKVNPIQQMQSLKFHKYLPSKTTGIYNEYGISSFLSSDPAQKTMFRKTCLPTLGDSYDP